MTRKRIGIIGGGISGLTAAYRLAKAGCDVTIFEASPEVGGLASGLTLAGYPVEKAGAAATDGDTVLDVSR